MIILRQKEFGFITSKIKRPLQVKIGKARVKASNKLLQSANKDAARIDLDNLRLAHSGNSFDPNSPLVRELKKEAYLKNNAQVRYVGKGTDIRFAAGHLKPKDIDISEQMIKTNMNKITQPSTRKTYKIIVNNAKRGRSTILVNPQSNSVGILAHEIGHAQNASGQAGWLKKRISDKLKTTEFQERGPADVPLKDSILRYIEERNATKNGIKLLKKKGISKPELGVAKGELEIAGRTYKNGVKGAAKMKLARKLQLPNQSAKRTYQFRPMDVSELL